MIPRQVGRRILLSVTLGAAVYAWIVWNADGAAVRAAFTRPGMLGVAATVCGLALANYMVRFVKWEMYRKWTGIELDRRSSLLAFLSGFVLSVTPGKVGEAFKSYLVKRVDGTPISRSAPIVLAERVTDLVGYLVLMAIGSFGTFGESMWIFGGALAVVAALVVGIASERVEHTVLGLVRRLPIIGRVAHKAETAIDSARSLLAPSRLALPCLLSVIGWGLECVGFWIVAGAMVPEDATVPGLAWCTLLYATAAVAGALSFLPGGLLVTEGLLGHRLHHVAYAGAAGAGAAAGAATILVRVCTLWFAVLVGLFATAAFVRRHGAPDEVA